MKKLTRGEWLTVLFGILSVASDTIKPMLSFAWVELLPGRLPSLILYGLAIYLFVRNYKLRIALEGLQEFAERYGVLFKKVNGGYSEVPYCITCKTPLSVMNKHTPMHCSRCNFVSALNITESTEIARQFDYGRALQSTLAGDLEAERVKNGR